MPRRLKESTEVARNLLHATSMARGDSQNARFCLQDASGETPVSDTTPPHRPITGSWTGFAPFQWLAPCQVLASGKHKEIHTSSHPGPRQTAPRSFTYRTQLRRTNKGGEDKTLVYLRHCLRRTDNVTTATRCCRDGQRRNHDALLWLQGVLSETAVSESEMPHGLVTTG